MCKELIDFVNNMPKLTNLHKIVLNIQRLKSSDNKALIFIDYKSAFNTINRNTLYNILQKKNILGEEEIQYIKALHSHTHYKCQDKIYYFEDGLPQGSPLSPALFNMYFEDALNQIKSEFPNSIACAQADDAVFLINWIQIKPFLSFYHTYIFIS